MSDKQPDKTEALAEKILDNARKQAKKTVDRAERDAKKILSQAENDGQAETDEILGRARERADMEARKISATIPLGVKRKLLEAQEGVLNAILEAGLHAAVKAAGEEPGKVLKSLILNTVLIMHEDSLIVEANEADRGRITVDMLNDVVAEVKKKQGRAVVLSLAKEPVPILGGVIVRGESGRLVCDNSLEARLERSRDALRLELATMLFDEQEVKSECG